MSRYTRVLSFQQDLLCPSGAEGEACLLVKSPAIALHLCILLWKLVYSFSVFACSAVQTDRTNARKAAKNTSVNYGRLGQR